MDQRQLIEASSVEGVGEIDMAGLQDLLNDVPSGSFVVVKGYISKESEKQATDGEGGIDESRLEVCNYFIQHGINYGRIKDKSEAVLQAILDGSVVSLYVSHGIWIDPADLRSILSSGNTEGVSVEFSYTAEVGGKPAPIKATATVPAACFDLFGNRKGKGRIPAEVSYELTNGHPLLMAAVEDALEGIRNPKEVDQGYEKFAKGGYWRDANNRITLYLRDCLRVHRVVQSEGVWNFKASAPKTAIRSAVERMTPKGRYRCMTFEPMGNGKPRFQSISIGGVSLLVDGVSEDMYFAPQEAVKEAVRASVNATE